MVAVVIFAYMAAAERGERLGVPGFEGSLIFSPVTGASRALSA